MSRMIVQRGGNYIIRRRSACRAVKFETTKTITDGFRIVTEEQSITKNQGRELSRQPSRPSSSRHSHD